MPDVWLVPGIILLVAVLGGIAFASWLFVSNVRARGWRSVK